MRRQLDPLAATPISFDPGFADLHRSELADGAHAPGPRIAVMFRPDWRY